MGRTYDLLHWDALTGANGEEFRRLYGESAPAPGPKRRPDKIRGLWDSALSGAGASITAYPPMRFRGPRRHD
jgi:hypothetical protein